MSISSSVVPNYDVMCFSHEKKRYEKLASNYQCCICYDDNKQTMQACPECDALQCHECMRSYMKSKKDFACPVCRTFYGLFILLTCNSVDKIELESWKSLQSEDIILHEIKSLDKANHDKYKCKCGSIISTKYKAKHERTNKHLLATNWKI